MIVLLGLTLREALSATVFGRLLLVLRLRRLDRPLSLKWFLPVSYLFLCCRPGGGALALSLFEMTPDLENSLCLGSVGNGLKFCMLGATSCTFTTHSKKIKPMTNHLYIASGRNSAFTHHHLDVTAISETQLRAVLQECHMKEEWVQLFHALKANLDSADGFSREEFDRGQTTEVGLQSAINPPKRFRADYASSPSETIPRSLSSFDSDFNIIDIPTDNLNDLTRDEALSRILLYWEDLMSNMTKFSKMLRQFQETSNQNLEAMDTMIPSVDSRLGSCPKDSFGEDCVMACDGIMYLEDAVSLATRSAREFEGHQSAINSALELKMEASQGQVDDMVASSNKAFADIAQFMSVLNDEQTTLNRLFRSQPANVLSAPSNALNNEVQRLNQKVAGIEAAMSSSQGAAQSPSSQELATLKLQMKLLEARLPTNNLLKLGGAMFQSRADVAVFVESKMPTNSFSMFHDVITLMERLSGNYVERKNVINEWYQATKVELGEHEARHVASFKITYPTVFGYVKEGSTNARHHLPAVKSFKDWNSFDAESGIKSFIMNGMEDLKLQLYQDISTFFGDQFYDARVLANDMHSKSQVFVAELSNWMDVFYQELLTTSEASEDEAWELVSACVKKVFEELRRVRASAANAMSEVDATTKCSTIMWAVIQAHRVMKHFLDMRFRNHPSITPVIILQIFKTRVTRVSHSTNLKRLKGRIAKLESTPAFNTPKASLKDSDDKKGGKN